MEEVTGGGSEREKSVGERGEKEREDVHIWSCSMALSLGGQLHTRPPLDLLKEGR